MYKDARKEYENSIAQSKQNHWKQVCTETENDVFGQCCKIVTRQLKHAGAPFAMDGYEISEEIPSPGAPIPALQTNVSAQRRTATPECTSDWTPPQRSLAVLFSR
ncbi:hypothetical protein JTB14_000994 [Gonioctena quinquepunctata]|nr:hypothetical protein JTB14_000994 [Gonioctena quinquepunctata]